MADGSTPATGGGNSDFSAIADRMRADALENALFQEKIAKSGNAFSTSKAGTQQLSK